MRGNQPNSRGNGLWMTFALYSPMHGLHVPGTRELEARRGSVQGLSREHPGAGGVCASPAHRGQMSALWCAQTLPAIRGVPRPALTPDDPEAGAHGRWAGWVMTPRFKGKPNFDLSALPNVRVQDSAKRTGASPVACTQVSKVWRCIQRDGQ
jgi:hypothetical protein